MSEEQVEVVQGHIDAFHRLDGSALSFLDQHVVLDTSRTAAPDWESAYGHTAVADVMRRYVGAFDEYAYEVARITDLGSGAVLAIVTERGRGKQSGVPVERSFAALYTVIEGKIARVTMFQTEKEALEAAGLSE
jgi:ketosteroid isomerase-like protein